MGGGKRLSLPKVSTNLNILSIPDGTIKQTDTMQGYEMTRLFRNKNKNFLH